MIFHFASEVSQVEIADFLVGTIEKYSTTFILTEINDNVTLSFPPHVLEHLLNLEDNNDCDIQIELPELEDEDELSEEDSVMQLIKEMKKNIKKPTLDQLLDKIKEKGLSSLSPYEKEILDEYSK